MPKNPCQVPDLVLVIIKDSLVKAPGRILLAQASNRSTLTTG
jgi:hypothetical protein